MTVPAGKLQLATSAAAILCLHSSGQLLLCLAAMAILVIAMSNSCRRLDVSLHACVRLPDMQQAIVERACSDQ